MIINSTCVFSSSNNTKPKQIQTKQIHDRKPCNVLEDKLTNDFCLASRMPHATIVVPSVFRQLVANALAAKI